MKRFYEQRKQLSDRDKGFSMAELVVAMVVIAIVLLLLMAVQTSALVTIANASKKQEATAFGNEAMEQMRAIPWNVLAKGLSSNFVTAAGGDPNVVGTTLKVGQDAASEVTDTLDIADPGEQPLNDPSNAWPPLFDETGSNLTVKRSPAHPGVEFEVRAYTTKGFSDLSGGAVASSEESVGIVVVVSWNDLRNQTRSTQVLRTTAYASSKGCGNLNDQPFLSSCQARFEASASSGTIFIAVSSQYTDNDPINPTVTTMPLLPGYHWYNATVATSGANASVVSQQVTTVEGAIGWGGEKARDSVGVVDMAQGFGSVALAASDNTASPSAPSAAPAAIGPTLPPIASTLEATNNGFKVWYSSDYDRQYGVRAVATDTGTCGVTGMPIGIPCARADLDNGRPMTLLMSQSGVGDSLRPFYNTGASMDSMAWAARFTSADPAKAGSASYTKCVTVSGAGCTSAFASQQLGAVYFSYLVGVDSEDRWNGEEDAKNGLVYITNYKDSVLVERGENQKLTGASISRSGTLYYFNGSGYSTLDIAANPTAVLDGTQIPAATWTSKNGNFIVVAHTRVTLKGFSEELFNPDNACEDELCTINAGAGSITIHTDYDIEYVPQGFKTTISVDSLIQGSTAWASYKAPPEANS